MPPGLDAVCGRAIAKDPAVLGVAPDEQVAPDYSSTEFLGLPGLLEPDQVAHVLRERQKKQVGRGGGKERADAVSAHRALAEQRKELNKLVAAYATKTGAPHANIHMDLRRACGGPELAQATSEQVTERIERIRRWFVGRR